MMIAWEHLVWRRSSRLQVDLPVHGPSLATLIKLIAKNRVLIADLDVEKLPSIFSLEPRTITHKPGVVSIVLRTKGQKHEEQLLHTLSSFGYRCRQD